ncbi:MAG: TIR domain-containing protein [Magnetococcales bacterium]|nr:TIR domain-containing protein [Magnetococcales bacterium]
MLDDGRRRKSSPVARSPLLCGAESPAPVGERREASILSREYDGETGNGVCLKPFPMWKPPTGEPCAGEPPARFGGRGDEIFPTPISFIDVNVVNLKNGDILMAKKRVFVSFDYPDDLGLKNLLVGQSRNPNSPFEIVDWSMKESAPQANWVDFAEKRIKSVDLVIVLVGSKTYKAKGVHEEINLARGNNLPVVQIIGESDKYERVQNAGKLYKWTWDNLRILLS